MDFSKHPIRFFQKLSEVLEPFQDGPGRFCFDAHRYKYIPKTTNSDSNRTRLTFPSSCYDDDLLCIHMGRLENGWDLGMTSHVTWEPREGTTITKHVPMVDMDNKAGFPESLFVRECMNALATHHGGEWYLYRSSARGVHAYSPNLIGSLEWIEFMGRCLLMEYGRGITLVDTRWVGHRLTEGIGVLRISRNKDGEFPTQVAKVYGTNGGKFKWQNGK